MSIRTFATFGPITLALAACSSAEGPGDDPAASEAAGAEASASAQATAGVAKAVEEDNDLYSFAYAYPAEADAIPELAARLDKDAEEAKATLISESEDDRKQAEANGFPYRAHSFSEEWKIVANLPRYLSLSGEFATYSGGAHGMYGLESLVWDKQKKAGVDGVEIFRSAEALDDALGQKLCDALNAERGKRRGEAVPQVPDGEDYGFNSCQHVKDATVLVGSSNGQAFDRIGIWFGPYIAGPYAEGSYELNFPVDAAVIEVVKPEYSEAFTVR